MHLFLVKKKKNEIHATVYMLLDAFYLIRVYLKINK